MLCNELKLVGAASARFLRRRRDRDLYLRSELGGTDADYVCESSAKPPAKGGEEKALGIEYPTFVVGEAKEIQEEGNQYG